MPSTTAGCPSIVPFATTTPSSACVTIPWRLSHGETTRSNGSMSSRNVPGSSNLMARSRALSSIKLSRLSKLCVSMVAASLMMFVECCERLENAHLHDARRGTEVVDFELDGGMRAITEHAVEHGTPQMPHAVDRSRDVYVRALI